MVITTFTMVAHGGKPLRVEEFEQANALATAEGVRKVLKDLEDRLPDDVAFDVDPGELFAIIGPSAVDITVESSIEPACAMPVMLRSTSI